MNKKGDITSQMLFYAFGAIVGVLIIFWGLKGISTFTSNQENYVLTSLKTNLDTDLEKLAVKRGSVKEFSYDIPKKYDQLCLFDLFNEENLDSAIVDFHPTIRQELMDKTENVFLIGKNDIYGFKSDLVNFESYPYYHCIDNIDGRIYIKAKGKVVDGSPTVLMLISNRVEKSVSSNQDDDILIFSSDGLLYMKIFSGTISGLDNSSKISIEIVGRGSDSETYDFQPTGATFIPPATIGVKTTGCTNPSDFQFLIGSDRYMGTECKDDFVLFDVATI